MSRKFMSGKHCKSGKYCKACGHFFVVTKNRKTFCSRTCEQDNKLNGIKFKKPKRAERTIFTAICKTCNRKFETSRRNKFYCRDSCRVAGFYEKKALPNDDRKIQRLCSSCNEEINIILGKDDINRIFCNDLCEYEYKNRNKKIYKRINIKILCDECKEKIEG